MVQWQGVVSAIEHPPPSPLDLSRRRLPSFHGVPIVIAGSSGAGKTRIWSALTKRDVSTGMSVYHDDGYMVRSAGSLLALKTIPGQTSRVRYASLELLFGPQTRVDGVIFVASNGYDHIWPNVSNTVAAELPQLDIMEIRRRNLKVERRAYEEICERIVAKFYRAPRELQPKWMLILVSKVDLFWPSRDTAFDYYKFGSGSEFDEVTDHLIRRIGKASMSTYILPVATMPTDYHFDSYLGSISASSHLTQEQCDASVHCLASELEVLCEH